MKPSLIPLGVLACIAVLTLPSCANDPRSANWQKMVILGFDGMDPELVQRRQHIIETTRAEEERFLATIEGGITRFDQIAPARSTQGSTAVRGSIGVWTT